MKERITKEYRMKQVFDQNTLREREYPCVQEEPAWCVAACPLHLDAKKLAAAVARGDFSEGLALMETVTPFTRILAAGCEAPCEGACKLGEIGDGIRINSLEQACVIYGEPKRHRKLPMMGKKKSVAVLGDDLFSLAVVAELVKKSYAVTLYHPGETLSLNTPTTISGDAVSRDLDAFGQLKFTSRTWSGEDLTTLKASYDLLCLSRAMLDHYCLGQTDETTMYLADADIFGGRADRGIVYALMDGKFAATSIDRYVQGVPVGQDRDKEGPYETRLYTSLAEVEATPAQVSRGEIPSRDVAMAEAERCIQCECLECVKGCAYLKHYKRYPKQALREVYNNLSIVMGNHMANGLINACTLCEQCVAICPNDFNFPEVCKLARDTMVETQKMPPSAFEFALLDMEFSQSEEFFLARHQAGFETSRYLFFPGCQMGAVMPRTLERAYADLSGRLEGGVGLVLGCCGAMAFWAGQTEMFDETITQLRTAWEDLGKPVIIAGCPTCRQMLSTQLGTEVTGIWDYLYDIMPLEIFDNADYSIQDACGARFEPEVQKSVRDLAGRAGLNLTEPKYSGDSAPCCGYGGLVSFSNREVAAELTDFAANQSPLPALSYCANCRSRFAAGNKDSLHLLELFYGREDEVNPTLSARRRNRKEVRRSLLKNHWQEEMKDETRAFRIIYDADVTAKMEERMILDEDIYAVFQAIRQGAPTIYEQSSETHLASHRLGNVTFWVRYVPEGNDYRVLSVYSLRMQVVEV